MWQLFIPLNLLLALGLGACGGGDSDSNTNRNNDPNAQPAPYPSVSPRGGTITGEANLLALLRYGMQAQVKNTPWAGGWWPYLEGGISGPAAKYDRARPGRDASGWESANHSPDLRGVQDWWGHCNGWAVASILFQEPRAPQSADGVEFTVAEQKALLTEIGMEVQADFFGFRSESSNNVNSAAFSDVYPNQFFLVLANYVGRGQPLLFDRYTGHQVWNQPIVGYQIAPIRPDDFLGTHPSAPNIHRLNMSVQVWWARDDVTNGHLSEPFQFADGPSYESRTLRFELWLDGPVEFDASGNITKTGSVILTRQGGTVAGGAWKNGNLDPANSHPDYLWIVYKITPSTGYTNPRLDQEWVKTRIGKPVS